MMPRGRTFWMYVLDWSLIITASCVALLLANVPPDSHTFSLLDLSISHPHRDNVKVPLWLLVVLAIITPVALITGLTLLLPSTASGSVSERKLKLRNLNVALLGLGVSLATSTIIYTGVKNLSGRPRPDFLATCQPNLDNIPAHTVGGFGQKLSPLWVTVDRGICTQPDWGLLNDGLRSFPSGHATIAFAGMWYLALWLCHRFRVRLSSPEQARHYSADEQSVSLSQQEEPDDQNEATMKMNPSTLPLFYLFLPFVPLGLAIFIAGTRYFDFRNHGVDVLAGSAVGSATAWLGFRWYHPSLVCG